MSRTILITGASRGIGAATARLAAARGYAVGVNYQRGGAAAQQLVREIVGAGGRALAVQADVSLEDDVKRLFGEVEQALGQITALVNNAGVLERQARVDEMDAARLGRVLATNVVGPFLCAREAVRRMSTRYGGGGGSIVNVSSRAAVLGSAGEYVDYAASKGAVDSLTVGLAKGSRQRGHSRQRRSPRSDCHRDSCAGRRGGPGGAPGFRRADAAWWAARGSRQRCCVATLRRGQLCDGGAAGCGRWALSAPDPHQSRLSRNLQPAINTPIHHLPPINPQAAAVESAVITQNRTVTCVSFQPLSSKWC